MSRRTRSGGSAATAAIAQLAVGGQEIVVGDDVYGGTFRYFERVHRAAGVTTAQTVSVAVSRTKATSTGRSPKDWIAAISKLPFTLKNPNRRASKMQLVTTLPRVLVQRGWKLELRDASGKPIKGSLKLGAEKSTDLSIRLVPGEPFTAAEVAKWRDAAIRIEGYANGILIGGMTYPMAPPAKG